MLGGGGRVLVAVRNDEGGRCVALLGQQHYQGVRAMAGMGWQARHCWSRKAAVTELTRKTRMGDDTTRGEGQTKMTSNESGCLMTQGNDDGGDNGGGDITLRASYSQCCSLRV